MKADGDSSQAQPLLAILETDFIIKVPWKQEGEEGADVGLPGTRHAHAHAHDAWKIAAPIGPLTYLPATSYQAPRSLLLTPHPGSPCSDTLILSQGRTWASRCPHPLGASNPIGGHLFPLPQENCGIPFALPVLRNQSTRNTSKASVVFVTGQHLSRLPLLLGPQVRPRLVQKWTTIQRRRM